MSLLTLLVILFFLAAIGGACGQPRWGAYSWSPVGLIALVLVLAWLLGAL